MLVLVATHDKQLERIIKDALQTGLSESPMYIVTAGSQDELRKLLERGAHYDLLISAVELPVDDNSVIRMGEHCGFQILVSLRERNNFMPVILISEDHDQQMRLETQRQEYSQWLERDFGLAVELPIEAQSLIDRAPSPSLPRYLRVTFTADSHDENWDFDLRGENFIFQESGSIILREYTLKKIREKSDHITARLADRQPVDWENDLRDIGGLLLQEISSSTDFQPKFEAGLRRIDGDLRHIKIWFRIKQTLHPIILEALIRDNKNEEFWMLQAPIYRRLLIPDFYDYPEPLFACGANAPATPLHCLLIAADTSGVVTDIVTPNGESLELERLTYIQQEHDDIRKLLSDHRLKPVSVTSSTLLKKNRSFRDNAMEALRSRRWDLVHYSGHSYFEGDHGYLFFPPLVEGDDPDKVKIGEFTAELPNTRFLYLSSCQSSHDNCVLALAKSSIPSAIGFRWRVDDSHAHSYAVSFYRHLFGDDERCLQHAFLSARKDAYRDFRHERIWASPILLVKAS
jgi:CheY-like chemotaxis protein